MAHVQATHLFTRSERRRPGHPDRWRRVGQSLARVVYAHMCLLLETEARASPTRASVWRAEQCLKEWERLSRAGLISEVPELSQVGATCWMQGLRDGWQGMRGGSLVHTVDDWCGAHVWGKGEQCS